jgi:hypothetical protein
LAFLDHQISDTTLRARRDEWIQAGVFTELLAGGFNGYDNLIGINLKSLIMRVARKAIS